MGELYHLDFKYNVTWLASVFEIERTKAQTYKRNDFSVLAWQIIINQPSFPQKQF